MFTPELLMEGRLIEDTKDDRFGEIIHRMRKAKRDLCNSRALHVCSTKVCNPESEESLIRQGSLAGPPISSNVYLCKFGVIHVCSSSSCTNYGDSHNQTCHISGIQHGVVSSSYDKGDSRTWHKKTDVGQPRQPPTKKAKVKKTLSEKVAKERARETVIKLLYSSDRKTRNDVAIAEHTEEAIEAKKTYEKERLVKRQAPFLTDVLRLMGYYSMKQLPLVEFEYDAPLIEYYACVMYQVWKMVLLHTPVAEHLEFESVCLGTLYGMRQGLGETLPRDEFLSHNLPFINELAYFGIQKEKINDGTILIMGMCDAARKVGVIAQLDVAILPQKNNVPQVFAL